MVLDFLTAAKWAELGTVKSESAVEGDKMFAKKAKKSQAKVFTKDTIDLNGTSAFLDKPYNNVDPRCLTQPTTVIHRVALNQSTLSPDEDYQ